MAMSGGVDSSVAALLLRENNYEVIGITMKTWDYESSGYQANETGCCSLDAINDARSLAAKHNIPHYVVDVREDFEKFIISDFIDEYLEGRTPNPCVHCNKFIKWGLLLNKADQLGCKYIATGHYARIREENNRFVLSKGKDLHKDQSYMLWELSQEALSRTLFPLGEYQKEEIKDIAQKNGFVNLAHKKESYEICFVPGNEYRDFLKHRKPNLEKEVDGGNFIDEEGNVAGKHKGYPFYTIGQRKGLNIAFGSPRYVTKIDAKNNKVYLGKREDLLKDSMTLSKVNFVKYQNLPTGKTFITKIRYKDKGTVSSVDKKNGHLIVHFHSPVSAITPGQSAVIYENEDVVAGGIID